MPTSVHAENVRLQRGRLSKRYEASKDSKSWLVVTAAVVAVLGLAIWVALSF